MGVYPLYGCREEACPLLNIKDILRKRLFPPADLEVACGTLSPMAEQNLGLLPGQKNPSTHCSCK